MIDKNQVRKIAELSRLKLKDEDIEKFSKDLSSILGHIEELKSLDVSGVEPTLHASSQRNVFRPDDEPDEEDLELAKKLVDLAPDSEDGYIKVKSILK